MLADYHLHTTHLDSLSPSEKLLINTINAHSYNLAKGDSQFKASLQEANVLIPDGIGVVLANFLLNGKWIKKIAGADLFFHEMNRLKANGGKCFFIGSTDAVLSKIKERAKKDYPNIEVGVYSPPYKVKFSDEDNAAMLQNINDFAPDVLFIGMTAPKQEKWAYEHFDQLKAGHIACIGAVFDFYAGTVKRAPKWMIKIGMEWLYRLFKEPKRMWRRYLIGNTLFIWNIFRYEVFHSHRK